MEEIRRAYAVLGLPQGAPISAVRKRFRELARHWHPDRFATDPNAAAEATERMRILNAAYSLLQRARRAEPAAATESNARAAAVLQRLSREEIDGMVDSIRSFREGPLDRARPVLRGAQNAYFLLRFLLLVVALAVAIWNWDTDWLMRFALILGISIVVVQYFGRVSPRGRPEASQRADTDGAGRVQDRHW